MKKAIFTLTLMFSAAAASFGCGSDKTRTVYVYEEDPYAYDDDYDDYNDDAYDDEPAEPDAGPFIPPFEAFDIAIEQSVTVGAFVIELTSARVRPRETESADYATVTVDFRAHNTSAENAWPLDWLSVGEPVLETGSKTFFGDVDAALVPGLRDGVGSLFWSIDEDLSPELLSAAVLTFGEADRNQAVVPLGALADVRTLADIPLADTFKIVSFRHTTIEVTNARVQYNARTDNEPLMAGTAWLVLEGELVADPDLSHEIWNQEDVFLQRPDGVSVAPRSLFAILDPSERADFLLQFEITQPVAGAYTFGVTSPDLPMVTQMIVVP
jgi:hypothetical protein